MPKNSMEDLNEKELLAEMRVVFNNGLIFPAVYDQIVKIVKEHFREPVQVDKEKKIEEIRMMIQKATSEYMPVYRRIYLNDAVEVEIRKLLTRQPVQVDEDTKNVIDNLVGLQECLEAGEDWCSVAVVAGAIELLLSQKRTVTWEWVRNRVHNMPTRSASHTIGTFVSMLEELGIEVVE